MGCDHCKPCWMASDAGKLQQVRSYADLLAGYNNMEVLRGDVAWKLRTILSGDPNSVPDAPVRSGVEVKRRASSRADQLWSQIETLMPCAGRACVSGEPCDSHHMLAQLRATLALLPAPHPQGGTPSGAEVALTFAADEFDKAPETRVTWGEVAAWLRAAAEIERRERVALLAAAPAPTEVGSE